MLVSTALTRGKIDPLDQELLLAWTLQKDRSWVLAHPEYGLTPEEASRFEAAVRRRESHEPLAYIVGEKEFFGLTFSVDRSTLIPRPETELLVEQAIQSIQYRVSSIEYQKNRIAVVDVGTGSGNIIISIAKHLQDSKFKIQNSSYQPQASSYTLFGIDISKEALAIAKKNAAHHQVEDKIAFLQSDLLEDIGKNLEPFDELFVLANLPYLSENLYENTDQDVRAFEPMTALVSGPDGLDHYRRLLAQLRGFSPGRNILFWLEISPEQAPLIPVLFSEHNLASFQILPDLSGRSRVVAGSF